MSSTSKAEPRPPATSWIYRARTTNGAVREGVIEAATEKDVARTLVRQKLIPESIQPAPKKISISLRKSPKPGSLAVFARQFATMVDAAVPLVRALELSQELTDDRPLKKTLEKLVIDVQAGLSLADAMRRHPSAFSEVFVSMVDAGEHGGMLDTILPRLATYLEKSQAMVAKVKSAMIYPMIIIIVAIGSAAVMLTFVVPTFQGMFASGGLTLPYPTQVLMNISEFVQARWLWLLVGTVTLVVGVRQGYQTRVGRDLGDAFLLRVPILGDVLRKSAIARFSHSMSSLLMAGSNLIDALLAATATVGNVVIEKRLASARPAIEAGEGISGPLAASGAGPPLLARMVEVGEQTGRLDEMFEKIGVFYEAEVDTAVDRLMKAMEPALLVVVGIILGGMVVALYLPIFEALTTIET